MDKGPVRQEMSTQSSKRQKCLQKYHCVLFVLATYCWVWGLLFSGTQIPTETPLQKASFPFASRCQLQIASWLGVGACACFPLSALGPHLE